MFPLIVLYPAKDFAQTAKLNHVPRIQDWWDLLILNKCKKTKMTSKNIRIQWMFQVLVIGGRDYTTP